MQGALPTLILFGVIIVALMLILVGILSSRRPHRAEWPVEAEAPPGVTPVAEPRPEASRVTEATPTAPGPVSGETAAELRAWHVPADGSLVVEFRGQRYRRLTDIRDGETGRQLLALIGELVRFSQGLVLPAEPPTPTDKSAGLSGDEFLKQLVASAPAPAPLRPTLIGTLERPASKTQPMPMGLAGQIEQVLQEQLVDNTSLRGRSVHVATAPDGSLAVEVDSRSLHWPDQVTDPAVREAVQKAIQTWERL